MPGWPGMLTSTVRIPVDTGSLLSMLMFLPSILMMKAGRVSSTGLRRSGSNSAYGCEYIPPPDAQAPSNVAETASKTVPVVLFMSCFPSGVHSGSPGRQEALRAHGSLAATGSMVEWCAHRPLLTIATRYDPHEI